MRRCLLTILLIICAAVCVAQTGYYIPSSKFSSSHVNDILQDRYGYVWIATENGLNRYDGYKFTSYFSSTDDSTSITSNIVVRLFSDSKGRLWVGTRLGLMRYNYADDNFQVYQLPGEVSPRIISMIETQKGEMLFGSSGRGLFRLDGDSIVKVPDGYTTFGGNWFFNQMMEDSRGRFWKCGYGEELTVKDNDTVRQFFIRQEIVVKLAEIDGQIVIVGMYGIYVIKDGALVKIHDFSTLGKEIVASCACATRDGDIYIGTRGEGLFVLDKNTLQISRVECRVHALDINTAKIRSLDEDLYGNLWIGCEGKGVVVLPKNRPQFSSWTISGQGYNVNSSITSICKGDDGIVWCTVLGGGIFGFDSNGHIVAHPASPLPAESIFRDSKHRYWLGAGNTLYEYNPLTAKALKKASFDCDHINCITEDNLGNLYISLFSRGFCIFNPETGAKKNFIATDHAPDVKGHLWNNWILAMLPDQKGNIWMSTSSGVSCYDPKEKSFEPYGFSVLCDTRMCYSLCQGVDGTMLIGTDQGIRVYREGDTIDTAFDEAKGGFDGKIIGYIAAEKDGSLWCSTPSGIWQYDAADKKYIGHFGGNGLFDREYTSSVGLCTDSLIYFAGSEGLTVFNPAEVVGTHKQMPEVKLTGFIIAGKEANRKTLSDGRRVMDSVVVECSEFEVSYLDNNIALEFSLLDFNSPDNVVYEYRINGNGWIKNSAGNNVVNLTQLQSGSYEIEVRALSEGSVSASKVVTVSVRPPWYRSKAAFAVYALLILASGLLIFRILRRKAQTRLYEEKVKFLINATHDIRSPLTLIMEPLAQLKSIVSDEKETSYLDVIEKNAKRLLLLVNQILDRRRIDKKRLQLRCRETDLSAFADGICNAFRFAAQKRGIALNLVAGNAPVKAWIDKMQFDKVVSNILSNALKYTPDGGEITVRVFSKDGNSCIEITDSGKGIAKDEMKKIFNRFYQGRNAENYGIQGTGIGLDLSLGIAQLHGGTITAGNRDDGTTGARFTVSVPEGKAHLKPDQIVASDENAVSNAAKQGSGQIRILIADDDSDLASYIMGELGAKYRFEYCPDGRQALKKLLEGDFDLVVSDVVMPCMDGISLLKNIKDNPNISQLPVILLSSKSEAEDRLEGLKFGADAYLAKPFSMEELSVRIDNLIDNFRRLKGKFSGAASQHERMEDIEVKGNDDILMDRIMKAVNAHLADPDFNVDSLTTEVGISRVQLHRKMKEITGLSSGKFLRNLRMEQAAKLLREGAINITQVADSIGYSDPGYFSNVFKKHFGISPSEYMEKYKGKSEE